MRIALTAFTRQGGALARALFRALGEEGHTCSRACPRRLEEALAFPEGYERVGDWAGARIADSDALLFVGASGFAVRAIAPYVRDKLTDPAVVSVDEAGRFAVPLLSGHVGGANDLARRVAALTGGEAAVSTATDVNGRFAVDQWAREQGFCLEGRAAAKAISAALLAGETVGLSSDFPIRGPLPEGVVREERPLGFAVTLDEAQAPFGQTLRLIPRILTLGIGCRRGTPAEAIARAVDAVLAEHRLSPKGVKQAATIDLKKDEPGLLAFCEERGLPLRCYPAEELAGLPGSFTPSAFVQGVTGVDNVCERAAVRAGGELLIPKQAGGGVTVAVGQAPLTLWFPPSEGEML